LVVTVHSSDTGSNVRAGTQHYEGVPTKGAPFHEQRKLRSDEKTRSVVFANGASEL